VLDVASNVDVDPGDPTVEVEPAPPPPIITVYVVPGTRVAVRVLIPPAPPPPPTLAKGDAPPPAPPATTSISAMYGPPSIVMVPIFSSCDRLIGRRNRPNRFRIRESPTCSQSLRWPRST
jgi:hypothetical protein